MFRSTTIFPDHKDLIHDVSFDYHSKRIATCSSDQSVKIWDQNESGQWICTASWKTHSGSVWRVTWAHPEFGKILATCSFDRTIAIWEEIVSEHGLNAFRNVCKIVDSRSSVTDVKFAPKHLGLMLASCSQDGIVRIYEAPDIMSLVQWTFQHEILTAKLRCSCVAWNPSKYHPPMLAVGSNDSSTPGAKINIFEYNESSRKWLKVETVATVTEPVHDIAFAPNLGRSFHMLAVASKNTSIISLKPLPLQPENDLAAGVGRFETRQLAQFDLHNSQVWRVSWNITGTILASSGADGCIRMWKANYLDNWKCVCTLRAGEAGIVQISEEQAGEQER